MSNSLRSNSAIFMLNTKSQNPSTFTNFFRLPPPGYTLPASNPSHKLTHQPLGNTPSVRPQPSPNSRPFGISKYLPHKLSLKSHTCILTTPHFSFQRGRQGGARGGTAAFATVSEFPLGFFSHLPNSGTPGSTRPCNCERVPPRMVFIFAKYKKVY